MCIVSRARDDQRRRVQVRAKRVLCSVPRVERYSHPKQLTALSESLETMHLSGVCYGDKTLRDMPCTDMLSTYTLIGY
jgi:uncharacterized Zn-finger protein